MKNSPYICILLLTVLSFLPPKTTLGYFDAVANPTKLQSFHVEGLKNKACGTVYPDGVLSHGGMPLGGLGTGYFCVDTDGRLGKLSILNRLPQPMYFGSPFFFLETEGERLTLATPKSDAEGKITQAGDVKSVDYFGHYPVVDMKMTLDRPIGVQYRAFSPFIPGDAIASNTPVAFFEVVLKNESEKTQKMKLIFAPNGFPVGEVEDYKDGDWSVFQTTHRPVEGMPSWVYHTYALGVENGTTEKGTAFIECEIAPGASHTARFVLAWNQPYRTYNYPENQRVNEASFSAQLSGVWNARTSGLPDTLPKERIQSALDSITRLNLRASKFGVVNAVFDDGTICTEGGLPHSVWSRGNFIQCNAMAAGVYLYHGRHEEGLEMGKGIMDTLFRGPHAMPWSQPCGLDMDHGTSCHGYDYLDHVIVWTYPMAIEGKDITEMCAPDGFVQSILDAAGQPD